MSDLLMGLGFVLAIFGPLLLVPIAWLLYRFLLWPLLRPALPGAASRWAALGLAVVIVVSAVLWSYLPGLWEFERLCAAHEEPRVAGQVRAEGLFRTEMFPYEASEYLREGKFEFVEAPDPYKKGVMVRYTQGADGMLRDEIIEETRSLYGVRKTFSQLPRTISMMEKVIYVVASGAEIARAANLTYHGGRLSILLGSYGMRSCPDILSEEGSRRFSTFYYLEGIVLGGEPMP